jgi:hypothetical protein
LLHYIYSRNLKLLPCLQLCALIHQIPPKPRMYTKRNERASKGKNARPSNLAAPNRSSSAGRRSKKRANTPVRRAHTNPPPIRANNDASNWRPTTAVQSSAGLSRSLSKMRLSFGKKMDEYVCCRTYFRNYLTHCPSIPDGSTARHVPVPFVVTDYITVKSGGGFNYNLVPWFPCSGLLSGFLAGNLIINGASTTRDYFSSGFAYPIGLPNLYRAGNVGTQTIPGSHTSSADLYDSTAMRFVSVSSRITYTGAAMTAAGTFTGYESKHPLNPTGSTTTTSATVTAPTTGSYCLLSDTTPASAYANVATDMRVLDGPVFSTGFNATLASTPCQSIEHRVELGLDSILTHSGSNFQFQPMPQTAFAAVFQQGSGTASSAVNALGNISCITANDVYSNNKYGGGLLAADNDWNSSTVLVRGVPDGATFLIKTCVCVEFTPGYASAFSQISKDSPRADRPKIALASRNSRRMGTVRPSVNPPVNTSNGPR